MFKKISILIIIVFVSCNLETPTAFSEVSLKEKLVDLNGASHTLEEVLNKHKGKKILIDVWASWCRDCLEGMPKVKQLQENFPDVVFLFLSVDEKQNSWKYRVNKDKIKGEHYNLPKGMKDGELVDFLSLRWIPRYLVIAENGEISLFKATNASDKDIITALKKTI